MRIQSRYKTKKGSQKLPLILTIYAVTLVYDLDKVNLAHALVLPIPIPNVS